MKIAVIFPGYSSQFVGMGKELYDNHRIVQEYFEEASNCLNVNFVKLCFASSEAELSNAQNAYTSVFLVSSAIIGLLKQEGIKFDAVAGYNMGEYAAIFAAQGMNLPDGLYLLNKYATFYQEFLKTVDVSALQISGISGRKLQDMCDQASTPTEHASIAIYETELVNIIAGHTKAVERVRDLAIRHGRKASIDIEHVAIEVGLHSPLMNGVVDQFKMYLEKVDFKDLQVPLLESVTGRQVKRGSRVREYIIERINEPVKWAKVLKGLAAYDLIIEVGPGTKLSATVKATYPDKTVISINKQSDIDVLKLLVQSPITSQATEK